MFVLYERLLQLQVQMIYFLSSILVKLESAHFEVVRGGHLSRPIPSVASYCFLITHKLRCYYHGSTEIFSVDRCLD